MTSAVYAVIDLLPAAEVLRAGGFQVPTRNRRRQLPPPPPRLAHPLMTHPQVTLKCCAGLEGALVYWFSGGSFVTGPSTNPPHGLIVDGMRAAVARRPAFSEPAGASLRAMRRVRVAKTDEATLDVGGGEQSVLRRWCWRTLTMDDDAACGALCKRQW
jgi:hypothetical protein